MVPKVWGGRSLTDVVGIPLPPGELIGETWELFDRPDGSSRVRGSNTTLAELMRRSPAELVGRGVPLGHGGRFPLLLKFLDARDGLSVQVHPDDAQARADGDSGKNECCVVLRAGPGARIVLGFKPGVQRAQFEAVAETAAVEDLLWSFQPKVGDVIHIPPGTVHGIGPDVVVFEVQQNSDLTYRLYDWGRGRNVHVAKGLAVTQVHAQPSERPVTAAVALADGGQQMIATPDFRLRRYDLQKALSLPTNSRYLTVTLVGGAATLSWQQAGASGTLKLTSADTVLVPACIERVALTPDGRADAMVCDPGVR